MLLHNPNTEITLEQGVNNLVEGVHGMAAAIRKERKSNVPQGRLTREDALEVISKLMAHGYISVVESERKVLGMEK